MTDLNNDNKDENRLARERALWQRRQHEEIMKKQPATQKKKSRKRKVAGRQGRTA